MSDLTRAMEVMAEDGRADPFRLGTVTAVSGGSATVTVGGASVPASVYSACAVGDRVLLAYTHRRYIIIGTKED